MELSLSVAHTPLAPLPRAPVAWLFAVVVAVGVASPVFLVFSSTGLGSLLAAAAFVFTGLTALVAPRARTPGRAFAGTVLGCALPPTVLFLPTLIGLVFAIPAGLLATAAVTPLVLAARDARNAPRNDDAEHLLAIGAVWLAALTAAVLLLGMGLYRFSTTAAVPGLGLASFAAALVLARDARRLWFLTGVERGRRPGYRLAREDRDAFALVHGRTGLRTLVLDTTSGDGPFRTATISRVLGAVRVPWARLLVMLATLIASLCTLHLAVPH